MKSAEGTEEWAALARPYPPKKENDKANQSRKGSFGVTALNLSVAALLAMTTHSSAPFKKACVRVAETQDFARYGFKYRPV